MRYFVIFCLLAQYININTAEELLESLNQFNSEIYQNCIAETSENVILSPFSIQTALTMVMMGAREQTADEMRSVMKYGSITNENIVDQYQLLLNDFNNSTSVKIANKIYIQQEYTIKKSFQDIAVEKFYSDAENVDFLDKDVSVGKVNKWVESKTNNKIQNILQPDLVDDHTRMVLVNAIYFKRSWKYTFSAEATIKDDFWVSETKNVQVDMMNQRSKQKYAELNDLNAKVIDLAYENSDISMLIILPNDRNGLSNLEEKLNTVYFNQLLTSMRPSMIDISLPKFKVEYQVKLKDILTKMGMKNMFTDSADFSGLLTSTEPLKVSDVIHKAFIEVNEEGSEASASTVVVVTGFRSGPARFREFKANHPFVYMIHNKQSVLFVGRFVKP